MSTLKTTYIKNPDNSGTSNVELEQSGTITINGGINASGIITAASGSFTGNVSVGGTLTYEDVTNVDSIGIITARSDVSIADKIIHTGDTDTAIRFPGDNTFTIETAGSERVRVSAGGSFGVGTSSVDSPLHVYMQSSDRTARFQRITTQYIDIIFGFNDNG